MLFWIGILVRIQLIVSNFICPCGNQDTHAITYITSFHSGYGLAVLVMYVFCNESDCCHGFLLCGEHAKHWLRKATLWCFLFIFKSTGLHHQPILELEPLFLLKMRMYRDKLHITLAKITAVSSA